MIRRRYSLVLAFPFLLASTQSLAQDLVTATVQRDVSKELVRIDAGLIRKLVGLAGNDPVLRATVSQELVDAIQSLDGHAAALDELVENLGKLRSKDELVQLTAGKKLRAYAASLRETHAARFAGHGDDLLRTIIGQGDGVADEAGAEALRLLRQAQDEIARSGAVSPRLGQRLTEAVRKLPPERARAARQLVRNQLAARSGSLFNVFLRTGVDGLFVLGDAYALSSTEDGDAKAARATATAAGYGFEVVGNVAVRALGGGAFLHGLVVSLSAAAVAEMVNEIISLQYDRENAARQAEWAEMELRLNAIRGMLRVDALIKQGQYGKARDLLHKVKQYYFSRPTLAAAGDDLFSKMQELEGKARRAEQLSRANALIAEARIPYMAGYRLARQGRQLRLALNHLAEAERALRDNLGLYPELQPALEQTRALIRVIERVRAAAPALGAARIQGPDRVAAGDLISFEVTLQGGVPDYQPVGLEGVGLPTGALVYWRAPSRPGPVSVTVRLRDDDGRTAEARKTVEVVLAEVQPPAGDLSLRAYTIRPGYREAGQIVPPQEIPAHRVNTWDEVHIIASLQGSGLRYVWSINGKADPSPHSQHTYFFRPEAEGAYTIGVRVSDASGRPLGSARWTLQAVDMVIDSYYMDPRVPVGD